MEVWEFQKNIYRMFLKDSSGSKKQGTLKELALDFIYAAASFMHIKAIFGQKAKKAKAPLFIFPFL